MKDLAVICNTSITGILLWNPPEGNQKAAWGFAGPACFAVKFHPLCAICEICG